MTEKGQNTWKILLPALYLLDFGLLLHLELPLDSATMRYKSSTSTCSMRRFFTLLTILFVFAGCNNSEQSAETADEFGPAVPSLGVPMPTAEILVALGPENDIPIQRLLPDPIFIAVGKPKQFLDSPVSAGGEWLVANTIVRGLQLFSIEPNSIERFVQSTSPPATVLVNVPNPQNPMAMPHPQHILISRRATIITFNTPLDRTLLAASVMRFNPEPDFLESLKRSEGRNEYYDLTPPNIGIPQRLAFGMLDERTAVIVEGLEDDIKAVFSDAIPQNAVLDRIKRTPIDANDLTILTSLEGLGISPEMLQQVLEQFSDSGLIPFSFVQAIKQHLRALTFSLNVSAAAGQPIISVYAEGRDEQGAEAIADTVRGVIVFGQTTLAMMNESDRQTLPIPVDFAGSLLAAISIEVQGVRVHAALNNFETLIPTVNEWIRNNQAAVEQEMLLERRAEQLLMLADLCEAYHTQNGKFPADIRDAEGTPLLSWRVTLLPMMGLENLYNEFKLDEPWDSETNLQLMETMPIIFHPFVPEVALPKTVVRFFNSPGTPFADADLKLEDLENPHTALMLLIVTPDYAVEWTKPESLIFDIDTVAGIVGNQILGVTFAKQLCLLPTVSESDSQYDNWKRTIESLVRGMTIERTCYL